MLIVATCSTCGCAVRLNTVFTRFNHKFCSHECLDVFDEKNDYGQEKEPEYQTEEY